MTPRALRAVVVLVVDAGLLLLLSEVLEGFTDVSGVPFIDLEKEPVGAFKRD